MRLIGVDVDLTVCPSDQGWLNWLNERCLEADPLMWKNWPINSRHKLPYNLGEVFEEVQDPMEYWRELDYSQFTPIEGSVEKLKALSQYFGIVFISAHKGTHGKSKYYWLEEHFPFGEGVMLTKEKYLMNNSVVAHIDDRLDMLEKFDVHKRVHYNTSYTQTSNCSVAMKIESWNEFSVPEFVDKFI